MVERTRCLSQFSAEEQRAAIALVEEYAAYLHRKQHLEKIAQEARNRLSAKPHVEALHQRPALAAFAELLVSEQNAFFQEQLAIVQTAQVELDGKLTADGESLNPRVQQQHEIVEAVRNFLKESGSHMPVVYDDVVWGEALIAGIYEFQQIVERELAETRTFLTEHNPEALRTWPFVSAASYLEEGMSGGSSVYEVADKYREFRATFARLRAEAEAKPV